MREVSEKQEEWEMLANELAQTRFAIQRTYLQFDASSDPDLIEAAVFEIKAQQARHSYLLRRLKALDAGEAWEEA
ncbi:MAG: DUF2508 family protein [Oscillospiraceae bacterium]|nr:DUF2508 family protein [Oscillospiraceae bacterium]